MPEYLAPGVYVEEVSFRSKSIEGVSTTTTGYVGPARYGPVDLEPDILTSLEDFERLYGNGQQLQFQDPANASATITLHNYLWHAARAFFIEGGKRLYVARAFRPIQDAQGHVTDACVAAATIPQAPSDTANAITVQARFPGSGGNYRVRLILRMGQNILSGTKGSVMASGLSANDIVWIDDSSSPFDLGSPISSPLGAPFTSPPGSGDFYVATYQADKKTYRFGASKTPASNDWWLNSTTPSDNQLDPAAGHQMFPISVSVSLIAEDGSELVWPNLALDPAHQRNGASDSLAVVFPSAAQASPSQARSIPVIITYGSNLLTGVDVLKKAIFSQAREASVAANDPSRSAIYAVETLMTGGKDGLRPQVGEYEGVENTTTNARSGLKALEGIEDISIVAAPGSTFGAGKDYRTTAFAIQGVLLAHAANLRYRVAVLDSGDGMSIADVRQWRSQLDSKYAALYYPWVRVVDPITSQEIVLPPSGFVTGIYARNDITRAVYKAPANEVVNLAIGFETLLNKAQQDVLNPEGVNCFRFFPGSGYRLWGARTISSDPEWKYVNVRRYFAYIEHSIDRGTQWAVFEPNGDALWDNVRRTIDSFLFNEWQNGALLGDKPEKAYFVRCDRSTMTQNDLDNGRLVCLIGIAPLKPAEYVIFRIGQWTADAKR